MAMQELTYRLPTSFQPGYVGHQPFSWSKTDSSYTGPHTPASARAFQEPLSLSYSGHKPRGWVPRPPLSAREASRGGRSLPPMHRRPETTSEEPLHWFGSVGSPPWRSGIGWNHHPEKHRHIPLR
mmetsp:Transcript_10990/g.20910  ORF Transcript_10990/g.20910 Transcript_10990/m.20910 type:complete len:125 (-) Transcript_10990:68-442(-)